MPDEQQQGEPQRPHQQQQQQQQESWNEESSRKFLDMAPTFVPAREEQIDAICRLIPAQHHEPFTAVELGAGDGALAREVLTSFPACTYVALERSDTLRERLSATLAPFAERVRIDTFTLEDASWRGALPQPLRVVLSSLTVHHLDASGKRQLFADLGRRIESGGGFVLADIIEPESVWARGLYARQWDRDAHAQSLATLGTLAAYDAFVRLEWNYFTSTEPDAIDHPSPLFDQLEWLRASGFARAECFWMRAGHAIYGGYKA